MTLNTFLKGGYAKLLVPRKYMFYLGCHLSSSGGFEAMAKTAVEIGANTLQYFSRNPRGGTAKTINADDVAQFLKVSEENNFSKIIAHAPYTMNLCSSTQHIRTFAQNMFEDDLKRLEAIPGSYYNFHPGSHTGQGMEVGIKQISDALNKCLSREQKTIVLLETMAGKGSEIGGKFEDLARIRENVELKDKIGVCFDTCHVFDGGYDIVNNLDGVLEEFDRVIGIQNLKVVHLNDSKNVLGSHKDRHEKIGEGNIGIPAIKKVINNKYLRELPFILETPQADLNGYADEISMLREFYYE